MPQRHCNKCGAFQVTPSPQPDLFGGPVPPMAADSPFATFIRESHRREDQARRRGVTRAVGAERRLRSATTHLALWRAS